MTCALNDFFLFWLHLDSQSFKIGLFQKKSKQGGGGWGYTFLEKKPWNFSFLYFTPGNSRQNKAQPLEIPQNCVSSLGNSKTKNKDPWKFHIIFFLFTLGNPTSFLINPWKFRTPFLWYPWKFHILTLPPSLDIFWNSPLFGNFIYLLSRDIAKQTWELLTILNLALFYYLSISIADQKCYSMGR